MLAALTLATVLQTKEELVAEIVAAQRATMDRGSYETRIVMDQTTVVGEMTSRADSETTGAWQSPNLTRARIRITMEVGETPVSQEMESFAVGGRMWQRTGEEWTPFELPFGMSSSLGGMMDNPLGATEQVLDRADVVTPEESQEVDGVRCRQYRVVLNGPAVAAMMGDMLGEMMEQISMEIDPEGSSMSMRFFVGEEDRLIRKSESETRMRMHMSGAAGGEDMTMEMTQTMTTTTSRFGEARVEVPPEIAAQLAEAPRPAEAAATPSAVVTEAAARFVLPVDPARTTWRIHGEDVTESGLEYAWLVAVRLGDEELDIGVTLWKQPGARPVERSLAGLLSVAQVNVWRDDETVSLADPFGLTARAVPGGVEIVLTDPEYVGRFRAHRPAEVRLCERGEEMSAREQTVAVEYR